MATTLRKSADPLAAKADLLVVCVPSPPSLDGPAAAVDAALGGAVARAVKDGEVNGKARSAVVFHAADGVAAPRVVVVGTGDGEGEDWRAAGAAAAGAAARVKARSVALAPPPEAGAARGRRAGRGAGHRPLPLRPLQDDRRRHEGRAPGGPGGGALAVGRGRPTCAAPTWWSAAVNAARDLGNTPSNDLTPTALADHAKALADATPGLTCTVLGRSRLEKLGAGALLGVAKGSDEPPRMIVLRYRPKAVARAGEVLGLVGKAVTFDSGGISIKPSGGMEEMKLDMGGGAAVLEGTALVAALGLPVEILAVVPATENMPSGHAIKPGDVLTAMNGAHHRGHQHRRRGPPDPGRRARLRRPRGRDPDDRLRDPDRRDRRGARRGLRRPVRLRRRLDRAGARGGRRVRRPRVADAPARPLPAR